MKKIKQGQIEKITAPDEAEFKEAPVVRKTMVLTIKDGRPKRVFYNNEGKYAGEEDVE